MYLIVEKKISASGYVSSKRIIAVASNKKDATICIKEKFLPELIQLNKMCNFYDTIEYSILKQKECEKISENLLDGTIIAQFDERAKKVIYLNEET